MNPLKDQSTVLVCSQTLSNAGDQSSSGLGSIVFGAEHHRQMFGADAEAGAALEAAIACAILLTLAASNCSDCLLGPPHLWSRWPTSTAGMCVKDRLQ